MKKISIGAFVVVRNNIDKQAINFGQIKHEESLVKGGILYFFSCYSLDAPSYTGTVTFYAREDSSYTISEISKAEYQEFMDQFLRLKAINMIGEAS